MTQKLEENTAKLRRSRVRSTILDAALVRNLAAEKKIYKKHQFQSEYEKFHHIDPDGPVATAPGNAWEGKKMDLKQAKNVAIFLGVKELAELELIAETSQWSAMLKNQEHRKDLFRWRFESEFDEDDDDWRTVDFELLYATKGEALQKIQIDEKWQLSLYGDPGDAFAVLLQSDKLVCQVAPLDHQDCRSIIGPDDSSIVFPPQPLLRFNKEDGLGYRRLIVVRSKNMPIQPKSKDTGHLLSALELEHFAIGLQQNKYQDVAIDIFEFVLVG